MLFNSLHFLIFFPLVVAAYFALPHRWRWAFLLAASYYFYMCWKAEYIVLIVLSTLIDYYAGIRMGEKDSRRERRKFLVLSLMSNLGLLFAFKYFNFFSESARVILNRFNIMYDAPLFHVLLPVGISFYTFQTMSYSISVYRGDHPPEKHFGIFALYVSFFPQLVAGPIERSSHLLPQFYDRHWFRYDRVVSGLRLAAWGMFKKVVIADRVAALVNTVYNHPRDFDPSQLVIATVFFAFQIFCDFSAYSDIAIGTARVLGFDLMKNFDRPYYSKSISEFWGRWHISLSTWFRDYLYIPLGGNRVSKARWYFNLAVTFVLSGLWHGANWTFLVWGALNGAYLITETVALPARVAVYRRFGLGTDSWWYKVPAVAWTFALTCFAWIFFRANSMTDALYVAGAVPQGIATWVRTLVTVDAVRLGLILRGLGLTQRDLTIAVVAIAFMEAVHFLQRRPGIGVRFARQPAPVRWAVYYALTAGVIFFGAFNQAQQFIYFQF